MTKLSQATKHSNNRKI